MRLFLFLSAALVIAYLGYVAPRPSARDPAPPDHAAALAMAAKVVDPPQPIYKPGDRVRLLAPGASYEGHAGVVVKTDAHRAGVHLVEVFGVGHLVADWDMAPIPEVP